MRKEHSPRKVRWRYCIGILYGSRSRTFLPGKINERGKVRFDVSEIVGTDLVFRHFAFSFTFPLFSMDLPTLPLPFSVKSVSSTASVLRFLFVPALADNMPALKRGDPALFLLLRVVETVERVDGIVLASRRYDVVLIRSQ
jgi:hypothetical protein